MSLCKITQYGYPSDPDGDSLTEAGEGMWDNLLTAETPEFLPTGCAITNAEQAILGWTVGQNKFGRVKITWPNSKSIVVEWEDRAPEGDPRVDLYMPHGFSRVIDSWGDYATVEAV